MYAISMVSIPQYVLLLLRMVLPKADWIPKWISALWWATSLAGALPTDSLFVLSIAFAFVNVSGEQISGGCGSPANISMVFILVPILMIPESFSHEIWQLLGSIYCFDGWRPHVGRFNGSTISTIKAIPGMFLIFSGMAL